MKQGSQRWEGRREGRKAGRPEGMFWKDTEEWINRAGAVGRVLEGINYI